MSDLVGRRVGPYEVRDQIGQGGMATVYRGYQTSLNRYVAIKVLPIWMAQDSQFVQRFRQEALAAGGLRHPNILTVLDAGTFEGQHYIVMDYASGGTLADRLRTGPMAPDQAAELIAQIADALDHAHRRGIVHRDIKPSNILLDEDGRPLLADFGIAQAMGTGPRLTQSGASIGTPEYMSPEQSQGERVDGRSDIYSLGIVLYQLLTGRVPFQATTPVATLYQVVHEPPPPPRRFNPNIPAYLENIILRALAKQPEQRFASAREMADALRQRRVVTPPPIITPRDATRLMAPPSPHTTPRHQSGSDTSSPAGAPAPTADQPKKRSAGVGILIGAISFLIVALLGGGIYLVISGRGGSNATPTAATANASVVQPASPTAAPTPTPAITVIEKIVVASMTPTFTPLPPTQTPIIVIVTVIPPTAAPTDTPTSAPTNTPRPTPSPTAVPIVASSKPGVILDFETFGTWRRGDEPYGSFVQSNERKHEGNYSGKLAYEIPAVEKHYVVFERIPPIAIPGQPDVLTLWVYGDGSNHYLNAWIQDSQGEVRQFTFGQIRHSGSWQPMAVSLDVKAPWPQGHIRGPDNGRLDYPISFDGLVLDVVPRAGVSTYSGAIYVDDLTTGGVAAPGQTAAPAATGSPTTPLAAPAPSGPLGGRIVYTAGNGATTDVVILDVASKGSRRLFPNARQPDIRKDGRVVFNGIGGDKNNLFSINADGSRETMNGLHPEDSYPHWSPSGESVVFQSTLGDGRERIYIQWDMTHAEEPKVLTVNGIHVYGRSPTWLENWRIAFSGCNYWAGGSHCGIWTVNSNGSGQPQQLTEQVQDRTSDSANGILLYASSATGNWEIYAIPVTGGAPRNLTNNPSQDVGATFSPDGGSIAFISNRDGGWGIWVMNADGSNPQKLIAVPNGFGQGWAEERLAWGP
jgi:serine/threonine-protein kinase